MFLLTKKSNKMYKERILKLYKEGKEYNEIAKLLKCAKSTVSYHCKKEGISRGQKKKLSTKDILEMRELYKTTTRVEVAKKFNITEPTVSYHCGGKRVKKSITEKKELNVRRVTEHRRKNKIELIEYKGGKCECCGYNKCNSALEFHHLNPKTKSFTISGSGFTYALDKLKKEVDNCILICANCHREIHEGLIKI